MVFADKLLQNGFRLATPRRYLHRAIDDMLVPPQSPTSSAAPRRKSKEIEQQYVSGLVTAGERYNKVVDIWGKAGDDSLQGDDGPAVQAEKSIDRHGNEVDQESFNSIYMMADSGAAALPPRSVSWPVCAA